METTHGPMSPMDGMMAQAMEAAFLKVMQDAMQPLVETIQELRVEIATLTSQQVELLAIVNAVRTGNPLVAKLLKVG